MRIAIFVALISLLGCKPVAENPQTTGSSTNPLAPPASLPCSIKPVKSGQPVTAEASYIPCTTPNTALVSKVQLSHAFERYCSCARHQGYCMVWKHGDKNAMGFTRASECEAASCQAYFPQILASYCENRWLFQDAN